MTIVFDCSLFVSTLVFPGGRTDAVLQRILDGTDDQLVSPAVIDEVRRVLAAKLGRDREAPSRVDLLLSEQAETVRPVERLPLLTDEPGNRIFECAVAGAVAVIVTGDKATLTLRQVEESSCIILSADLSA